MTAVLWLLVMIIGLIGGMAALLLMAWRSLDDIAAELGALRACTEEIRGELEGVNAKLALANPAMTPSIGKAPKGPRND